jgi:hypothetical protein
MFGRWDSTSRWVPSGSITVIHSPRGDLADHLRLRVVFETYDAMGDVRRNHHQLPSRTFRLLPVHRDAYSPPTYPPNLIAS